MAWRNTSPVRSTPGPLPYHMPNTPSNLPSPRSSACCEPHTAVAARSSLMPPWKRMSLLFEKRLRRAEIGCRGRRAASRDSRVTKPAVLRPLRRSSSFCIRQSRTRAWKPVTKTWRWPRSYLSSSLTSRSAITSRTPRQNARPQFALTEPILPEGDWNAADIGRQGAAAMLER